MRILITAALWVLLVTTGQAAELTGATDPDSIADLRIAQGHNDIAEVWLNAPVTRYPHFVQGSAYEPGGVRVRMADGQVLTLMLDDAHVFEDRQPRLADLDNDGRDEIVLVLSSLAKGASLAAYSVEDGAISLKAQTPYIGQPFRWLNPAGIADFDGDGQMDVALVAMPHLVKRLEFWTLKSGQFNKIAEAEGFSNHRNGSVHTDMAVAEDFNGDGKTDLVLPGADRRSIRLVSVSNGQVSELDSAALADAADGAIRLMENEDTYVVSIPLESGQTANIGFPKNGGVDAAPRQEENRVSPYRPGSPNAHYQPRCRIPR